MRTLSFLALAAASTALLLGCAADPTPEPTGESSASQKIAGGPSTGITVDCNDSSNASCYECNRPNGAMCCLDSQTCTVIPCPKGGCRYIARTIP